MQNGTKKMSAAKENDDDGVVHFAYYFIAGIGRTACGTYSDNVTARADSVTCPKCARKARVRNG